MYWLFLVLALAALLLAISTTQMWLLVLSALAALLFLLLWVKGLYVARMGNISDAPRPLHAAEMQALREQYRKRDVVLGSAESATGNAAPTVPATTETAPLAERGPTQP
jgi:hypothetical protein